MSVWRISVSRSTSSVGYIEMPMLAEITISSSPTMKGRHQRVEHAARHMRRHPRRLPMFSAITVNSSPPRRDSVCGSRARPCATDVAAAQATRQGGADMLQQPITDLVAEAVVDQLEAVEIEKHQRHRLAGALRPRHRLAQSIAEQRPVGQPGEAVEIGQLRQALLGVRRARPRRAGARSPLAGSGVQRCHAHLQRAVPGARRPG